MTLLTVLVRFESNYFVDSQREYTDTSGYPSVL